MNRLSPLSDYNMKLEVYQETTHVDVAEVDITPEQFEELRELRLRHSKRDVQSYLRKLVEEQDAEWEDGGFVDGQLPHFYEVDGSGYTV